MTCSHCMKEYGSEVQICPECGQNLDYGAPAVVASGPAPGWDTAGQPTVQPGVVWGSPPQPDPQFNLSTTVSVSGSTSIRGRLRPRNVGEMISETLNLYKENWKLFALVVLVFYGPAMILQVIFTEQQYKLMGGMKDPAAAAPLVGWMFAYVVCIYATLFLTTYSLTRAVSDIYLGKTVTLKDILRPNNRFWGYLGAVLICGVITLGILLLCMLPLGFGMAAMIGSGHSSSSADGGAIVVVLLALLFAFFCCFLVVPAIAVWFIAVGPTAVVEGKGSLAAIQRGISLVKGFYWKAAGLLVLTMLIAMAINSLITSPYMMIVMGTTMSSMQQTMAAASAGIPYHPLTFSTPVLAFGALLGGLASCITMPLLVVSMVLFYYDLRIRKEGFDLQMLAEQLGYGVGGQVESIQS